MKRLTISSVTQSMCYGFAALLLTVSCANDDTVQEGKQKKTDIPTGSTVFTGTSQPNVTTRTAILNHTKGAGASVNWSNGDKIWVKDNAGTWQQSGSVTFPLATNKAEGLFALSGTYTGDSHDIVYTNTAVTSSQPQVEIKATQRQTFPNNFDHAGASGDCGIAKANKVGSDYKFTLDHKASYLCFIPRTTNEYVKRSRLFKVEIMSDDDIAGTYNIADDGTLTLASGGSKTITVTTSISEGFAIDNAADDMSKNAFYAVVAPGTHTFRIRYWLRNTTDHLRAPIEGTVSKIVTLDCTAGSIHDITANLNPHNYEGDKYYMWDAQQNYWSGHEWNTSVPWQPVGYFVQNDNYPKDNKDLRYYLEGGGIGRFDATQSCAGLPNVNEMTWYAAAGDPHLDEYELWTTMGHLYQGGMWFKKKANISGYNPNTAYDGIDWRTELKQYVSWVSTTLPSAADTGNYFFLPVLGSYQSGQQRLFFNDGQYWSSSACPSLSNFAYELYFQRRTVRVVFETRREGLYIGTFE